MQYFVLQGSDLMLENDYKWFLRNYDELYNKYGHSFLAIKDEQVIGVYESFANAVRTTAKTNDFGTFIVQECNGDESAYTNYIASMNFM